MATSNLTRGKSISISTCELLSVTIITVKCTLETIKEDTRDLLDKYSQLLLESLQQKIAAGAGAAAASGASQKESPDQKK